MRFETNHIPNIAPTHEKNQDSRSKSTVIASLSFIAPTPVMDT